MAEGDEELCRLLMQRREAKGSSLRYINRVPLDRRARCATTKDEWGWLTRESSRRRLREDLGIRGITWKWLLTHEYVRRGRRNWLDR